MRQRALDLADTLVGVLGRLLGWLALGVVVLCISTICVIAAKGTKVTVQHECDDKQVICVSNVEKTGYCPYPTYRSELVYIRWRECD